MKTIDLLIKELPALGGWPDGAVAASFLCSKNTLSFANKNGGCPLAWRFNMNYEVEDRCTEVTREQYEAALAAKNDGWIEWGGGECSVECGTVIDVKYRDGVIKKGLRALIANEGRSASRLFWVKDNITTDIIAYRLHKTQDVAQTEAEQEADLNECIGQTPAAEWNGEGLPPVGCECEWQDKNTKQWNPVKVVYASEWVTVIREINKEKGDDLVEIAIENYGDDARLKFRPTRSEAERKRHDAAQALCYAGGGIGKVDESAGIGSCWFDVYDAIAAGKIPGVKLEG